MDKWKTTVLTRAKAHIPAPEEQKEGQTTKPIEKKNEKLPSGDIGSTKANKNDDGEDSDEL